METDSSASADLMRLSRAVRFGLASIVFGLSYLNIHCAFAYKDLIEGLDGGTGGVASRGMIHYQPLFIGLSILFPVAAFLNIFTPGKVRSIYISGFLVMAVFVQLFFTWFTITGPISKMAQ